MPGRVFVEPWDREQSVRKSGLLIAAPKFRGPPNIGRVHAVADDIQSIQKGDVVVFEEPNPNGFKHEGIGLLPLKIDQVRAIVNIEGIENGHEF